MESFAGADGNAAPTTLAATHAALLRLAAGHGTVSLDLDVWDYLNEDEPRQRITWGAAVFARAVGRGTARMIASVYSAETPAEMLASIAAQLAAYAAQLAADDALGALGDVPGTVA